MVAAILAAGSGDRTRRGFRLTLWHLAGLTAGAGAMTAAASGVGGVLPFPRAALAVVVGGAAVVWGGAFLAGRRMPVASCSAQVPLAWRYTMTPAQYAFSYGVGLGVGALTRIVTLSFYVLVGLLLIASSPLAAAGATAAYALARAVPVAIAVRTSLPTEEIFERLERLRGLAYTADALALVGAGAVLAVSLAS